MSEMKRVMHFDVPVPDEIADKVDNMSEDEKAKFLAGCAYMPERITDQPQREGAKHESD